MNCFSGSYQPGDVTFLLKPLHVQPVARAEKERLIQSGSRHYSEMIGREELPDADYFALFDEALAGNAGAMAHDVFRLARHLVSARRDGLTLVSLARAGTPVGVLLRRCLAEHFGVDAAHYSISVIRDRGVDAVALRHILRHHAPQTLAFVDGWTGKGVIARELARSLSQFNAGTGHALRPELFVLCDLAGVATAAGSSQDYLIPSAILNAVVSGLVSRSILNEQIGPDDFHGCLTYPQWAAEDRSRRFIEHVLSALRAGVGRFRAEPPQPYDTVELAARSDAMLAHVARQYGVGDVNLIKPGIGEATRVLLRRVPRLLLVRDAGNPAVRHLIRLATQQGVPVLEKAPPPLEALAIIQSQSQD
jgi:hypothetical protein